MICPNCQSENREGAKFCDQCGFPLSGTIARVAAAITTDDKEEKDSAEKATSDEQPGENVTDNEDVEATASKEGEVAASKDSSESSELPENSETFETAGSPETSDTPESSDSPENSDTLEPSGSTEGVQSSAPSKMPDASDRACAPDSPNITLPVITVAGLNADDEGNPFDASEFELDDTDLNHSEDKSHHNDTDRESDSVSDEVSSAAIDTNAYHSDDDSETDSLDETTATEEDDNEADAEFSQSVEGEKPSDAEEPTDIEDAEAADEASEATDVDEVDDGSKPLDLPEIDESTGDSRLINVPGIDELIGDKSSDDLDEQPTLELPTFDEESHAGDNDLTSKLPVTDERLVDEDYEPPEASWSSGGTMEMPRVEGEEPAPEKNFRAPDSHEPKKKRKRGRVVAIVIIIVVVLAALVAVGTYCFEFWGGKTLPDVVGRTQTDATVELESLDFKVNVHEVKSDDTEGIVLSMDPGAGARLDEGTEVTIDVASSRIIPTVVGLQCDEAKSLLKDEGFEHVKVKEQASDKTADQVLKIKPDEGSRGTSSTKITLTIAVPFTVPDISGMSYDEAKSALKDAGYKVDKQVEYSDDVDEGSIISMDPKAGTELKSGSTVTLSVAKSRSSELIEAAKSYLSDKKSVKLDGTTYEIDSVDDVSYDGDDVVSFTITGRAATELDGETVYGSSKQKSGKLTFDSDNNVVSVD